VVDVRPQRQRGGVLAAVEEDRGAGHRVQRGLHGMEVIDERPQLPLGALPLAADEFAAFLPGGQDGERDDGDQRGKPRSAHELGQPRSAHELGQVDGEEQKVHGEEEGGAGRDGPPWPAPLVPDDGEEQQGGDGDRAGHRHAERVGQRG